MSTRHSRSLITAMCCRKAASWPAAYPKSWLSMSKSKLPISAARIDGRHGLVLAREASPSSAGSGCQCPGAMRDSNTSARSGCPKDARRQLSVGFVLLPNFTLVAFSTIVDLLRLSADEGDRSRPERCSWSVLAPDLAPISASCGLHVQPWETFNRPERFDYIVVVGGLIHRNLSYHPKTLEFLREASAKSVSIVGVCTGSFAMIEAQLMRGRKCCVSWYHFSDLVERYSDVIPIADQLFVEDGRFITCAGGMSGLDLGAWMVERHLGPGRAQKSLHIMVTDTVR